MVSFPLLLIPLAIYNIIVFLMPGVSFADPLIRLTLMSGAEWGITLADILLALGVLLLLLEVIKGARPGAKYLTDHFLSFVVFGAAAAEFLLWPKFGTSTFFLLVMMSAADFLSGLALRARRGTHVAAVPPRRTATKAEAVEPHIVAEPIKPAPEPQVEAAPAPVPSAASVAESVLMDDPQPKSSQPVASPDSPLQSTASPEFQPAVNSPSSPEAPPR